MRIDKYLIISHTGKVDVREREPSMTGKEIAVRLQIEIPDALFKRPVLSAMVSIPQEAVPAVKIDAEVAANIENLIKEATGMQLSVKVVPFEEEKTANA